MAEGQVSHMGRRLGLAIIVAAILLTAAAAWAAVTFSRQAAEALDAFVVALGQGNLEAAAGYLDPGLRGNTATEATLASLLLLAQSDAPRIEAAASYTWGGFFLRREVAVPLVQPEDRDMIGFRMVRGRQGWVIGGLPNLLAHPAALLLRGQGGRASLTIRGQELQVNGAGPGAPGAGPEIGFGVALGHDLLSFQPSPGEPLSKLLRTGAGLIETESGGIQAVAADRALYDLTTPMPQALRRLLVGSTGLRAYTWGGQIYGIAQVAPFTAERIRVVLGTSGFAGLEHSRVTITSPAAVTIHDRVAGRRVNVSAGTTIVLRRSGGAVIAENASGYEWLRSDTRLHIVPAAGQRLTVTSITRGYAGGEFRPAYRGYLEVAPSPAASGLLLVNDVPLNEYLYSVVPSEMPVAFGLEALRVQALAARAYAVASMQGGGYGDRGAHVDDSVLSQVYNNVQERDISNQAVDETSLEVPVYQGRVVDARFYSTSSGFTANSSEVWSGAGGQFPGPFVPYLRAVPQTTAFRTLPNEETVARFLTARDLDSPDAAAPFFRWTITMTRAEVEASLRANLAARYSAQPGFVLTRDQGGNYVSRSIPGGDPLGTLTDIKVTRRGEGGNIMELAIDGTAGSYKIVKEYNVRFTLRPVQYLSGRAAVLTRLADGTTRSNYSILPSAFAVIDLARDGASGAITTVTISGGGNGHGAGMSQTGAHGLAMRGLGYREILQHYYPGSEVLDLAGSTRLPEP